MSSFNLLNDMYTRIKNAHRLKLNQVFVLKSKKIIRVLDVLYLEGFIRGYRVNTSQPRQIIVLLKYSSNGESVIKDFWGISKPGKGVYTSVAGLWRLYKNSGICCYIISTSKGVMSLSQALKLNVGGKLLCGVA